MPVFRLLCLANSIKYQGRCIAGIRLDNGAWVRPVSTKRDQRGALFGEQYCTECGQEIRPLDVVERKFLGPCPTMYQPENWLIGPGAWTKCPPLERMELLFFLRSSLYAEPYLFYNTEDRVSLDEIRQSTRVSSLALIQPENLHFRVTTNVRGEPRLRAEFSYNRIPYDLVVTDPVWRGKAFILPQGRYSLADLADCDLKGAEVYLTVSLGEPFEKDNKLYKLVAAVIVV